LVLERPTERQNSKMSKSIRLSLTSQCRRLKLLGGSKSYGLLSRAKSWGSSCSLCSPCSNAHEFRKYTSCQISDAMTIQAVAKEFSFSTGGGKQINCSFATTVSNANNLI